MSREKQIEVIKDICPFYKEYGSCDRCNTELVDDPPCYFECMANAIIDNGYRKQSEGEWKPYKDYYTEMQIGWICSKCSSVSYDLSNGDTDFCPNCGAKMEGGE